MVVLRKLISQDLELKSRINSHKLFSGVDALNKSIMNDYMNLNKPSPEKEEDFCDLLVAFGNV